MIIKKKQCLEIRFTAWRKLGCKPTTDLKLANLTVRCTIDECQSCGRSKI